jgi:hypothetical protein
MVSLTGVRVLFSGILRLKISLEEIEILEGLEAKFGTPWITPNFSIIIFIRSKIIILTLYGIYNVKKSFY